jgi:hypothetical protein
MNTVWSTASLPVYLVHTSNPSVPNHPATPATAFCLLVAAGQRTRPKGRGKSSHGGHGAGFAQRSQARRSAWSNRVYDVSIVDMSRRHERVVHLWQLSTSGCPDVVAFSSRRVNVPPDGDLHPAVWSPSQAHERGIHSASTLGRTTAKRTEVRAPEKSEARPARRMGRLVDNAPISVV